MFLTKLSLFIGLSVVTFVIFTTNLTITLQTHTEGDPGPCKTNFKCKNCQELKVENGKVDDWIVNDKILRQAHFSCNSGFTLDENKVLNCLQNGDWNGDPPTCYKKSNIEEIKDSDNDSEEETTSPDTTTVLQRASENNFPIAVYVLVPVITVVFLAIILTIIIWRKSPVKCMKTSHFGKESDKNSTNYIGNQNQNIQLGTNAVQQSDYEYTDAKSDQGIIEDSVDTPYYCTIETELAEETDTQHRYENAHFSTEPYESLQAERQTNDQSYDSLNIQE